MSEYLLDGEISKFIQVKAGVRYWEDAIVNNEKDVNGTMIPLRNGDLWEPIIDIETGKIQDWPNGIYADIHYKVCDQGEYWLLDSNKNQIAKWKSDYVPDEYLCHGQCGFGDYIIFKVEPNGIIKGWNKPEFYSGLWVNPGDANHE